MKTAALTGLVVNARWAPKISLRPLAPSLFLLLWSDINEFNQNSAPYKPFFQVLIFILSCCSSRSFRCLLSEKNFVSGGATKQTAERLWQQLWTRTLQRSTHNSYLAASLSFNFKPHPGGRARV